VGIAWILCFFGLPPAIAVRADDELPAVYLTIVVHNEEDTSRGVLPKANIPDHDGDEVLMRHFADAMRAFAGMAANHGARINFGSDWTFSRGVARFEPTFYADLEALGHEIDAHAHQSPVPYHDVREEIAIAGGTPTYVASGLNEVELQEQLNGLDATYPEFQILWALPCRGTTVGSVSHRGRGVRRAATERCTIPTVATYESVMGSW